MLESFQGWLDRRTFYREFRIDMDNPNATVVAKTRIEALRQEDTYYRSDRSERVLARAERAAAPLLGEEYTGYRRMPRWKFHRL